MLLTNVYVLLPKLGHHLSPASKQIKLNDRHFTNRCTYFLQYVSKMSKGLRVTQFPRKHKTVSAGSLSVWYDCSVARFIRGKGN